MNPRRTTSTIATRTDSRFRPWLWVICALVFVAGVLCGRCAYADTFWLTSPQDNDWKNVNNWSNGLPSPSQLVQFTTSSITTTLLSAAAPYQDRSALGIVFSGEANFTTNVGVGGVLYTYGSGVTVNGGTQTFNVQVRPSATGVFPVTVHGPGQLYFNSDLMAQPNVNATVIFGGAGGVQVSKFTRRWANQATNIHLVKNDSGTLTIVDGYASQGSNNYIGYVTGTTTINGGKIVIDDESNLGGDPGGYFDASNVWVPGSFDADALLFGGGTLRATASFAIDDANRGITVGAGGGTFEVDANQTLTVANPIAGSGTLSKTGTGTLLLSGANTGFAGPVNVSAGTLTIANASALGGAAAGTTVANGARLQIQGGITVAEPISITGGGTDGWSGALKSISGTNTLSGPITVNGYSRIAIATNGLFNLTGGVTGSGGPSFCGWGGGTIAVSGQPISVGANDLYAIDNTTLSLNVGGNAWRNTYVSYQGTLKLGVDDAMPTGTVVTLGATSNGNGILDLFGHSQTIAGLTDQGTANRRVVNSGGGTPTLTINNSGDYTFAGILGNAGQDSFNLVKTGTGRLTLSGANTYSGTTAISQGTLALTGTGAISSSLIDVGSGSFFDVSGVAGGYSLVAGTTLQGNGTVVGPMTVAGTLAPGTSPGILHTGNVTFAPDGLLQMELNGTDVGTGYDQLDVSGTVNLGAGVADLGLLLGFAPNVGGQFTLINNDGADPIVGFFRNMPEGSVVSVSYLGAPYRFLLSYAGGAGGNDLVLTSVPEPATLLLATCGLLGLVVVRRAARRP